jgi:hypothetical protein
MLTRTRFPIRPLRLAAVLACLAYGSAALAADPFYLGTWKIVSAAPAPWSSSELKPYQPEMKSLPGKTVVIKPNEILGPRQLACKRPKYEVKDYPADMLFQGMFGEMQSRDKSVDPVKVASKIGFHGTSWKTLETGCGNEIDLHFLDPSTAAFGLNNVVYTLKKE